MIISRSSILRMRNITGKRCRGNDKHIFYVESRFFSENPAGREIMWEKTVEPGRLHGTYPLHAGYLRLQTHLQNM